MQPSGNGFEEEWHDPFIPVHFSKISPSFYVNRVTVIFAVFRTRGGKGQVILKFVRPYQTEKWSWKQKIHQIYKIPLSYKDSNWKIGSRGTEFYFWGIQSLLKSVFFGLF